MRRTSTASLFGVTLCGLLLWASDGHGTEPDERGEHEMPPLLVTGSARMASPFDLNQQPFVPVPVRVNPEMAWLRARIITIVSDMLPTFTIAQAVDPSEVLAGSSVRQLDGVTCDDIWDKFSRERVWTEELKKPLGASSSSITPSATCLSVDRNSNKLDLIVRLAGQSTLLWAVGPNSVGPKEHFQSTPSAVDWLLAPTLLLEITKTAVCERQASSSDEPKSLREDDRCDELGALLDHAVNVLEHFE